MTAAAQLPTALVESGHRCGDAGAVASGHRAGDPITLELLNYRKDGLSFWNQISITPMHDASDDVVKFVGLQRVGCIDIRTLAVTLADRAMVRIAVGDDGSGMEPDTAAHIFEAF